MTWNRGDARPTVQLTQTGFKALEQQAAWGSIDAYPGIYTGKLTPVEDRFFTESAGQNVFVYDAATENSAWMDARVYDEFIKDTSRFGTITSSYGIGDGRGGVEYNFVTTVFTADDGSTNELAGFLAQSVYVYPSQGEHYLINNEPVPAQTDPATIDWSQQGGLIGNQQALYYQDGDSALIIAANPDGTPKEGAKAIRSDWLGFQMSHSDRFNWNDGTGWAYGSPYTEGITLAGALGVPVADGYYVEENGQTYYLQDFEGGHIKWTVPANKLIEFDDSPVEITLNALGQARSDANDAKLTLG